DVVLDRVGRDARESLDEAQRLPRPHEDALRRKVAGLDDECVPSHRPRESPLHRRMVSGRCGRPSIGMMRASWANSMYRTTNPGVCRICESLNAPAVY